MFMNTYVDNLVYVKKAYMTLSLRFSVIYIKGNYP